ncbi:MAG: diguanylate cyclase [Treponema sp.]|nr:diguanylate cyclase [Treponema sp.]
MIYHRIKRASLLLLILTVSLTVFLFFVNVTYKDLRNQAFYTVQQNARETCAEIDSLMNLALSGIQLTSSMVSQTMDSSVIKNPKEVLSSFLDKTPFNFINYVNIQGMNISGGSSELDVSSQNYFNEGIAGRTGIDSYYREYPTKESLLVFYTPLFYEKRIVGTLNGIMNADETIKPLLKSTFFDSTLIAFLCDENFNIISSTHQVVPTGLNLKEYDTNKLIHTIIENAGEREDSPFNFIENGKSGVACVKKIRSNNWYVITIVPPESLKASTDVIAKQSIIAIIIILLIYSAYFSYLIYRGHKKRKLSEKKHMSAIYALSSIYQDVFVVNFTSSKMVAYRMSDFFGKKYGKNFLNQPYEKNVAAFIEQEVFEDDRELFYTMESVEKVKGLLSEKFGYSFIYRILRNEELQYYQCDLLKADATSEEFIVAFKNVNEIAWKKNEQAELQSIQEALNSGQWSMDFDRNFEMVKCNWSDAFRRMLGYANQTDFPNTLNAWTDLIHDEDKNKVLKEFNEIVSDVSGNKTFDITYRILTKNRGWRWVRSLGRLSRREDGSPMHFIGTFTDVDNQTKQLKYLSSIASIYYTMHVIDLENNTVSEISASDEIRKYVNKPINAIKQMDMVINHICVSDYLEATLEFTDLTTVSERMKGKRIVSSEFLGKYNGWVRASFIAVDTDNEEKPKTVIFVTQLINEEKARENKLITDANTDELTGMPNRHAFETDLKQFAQKPLDEKFTYVSIDVNSLKVVNDKLGHNAGDELLKGAADCLSKTFDQYGKIYRTGGDEFQAIIFVNLSEVDEIRNNLKDMVSKWTGNFVKELSVSVGFASRKEFPHDSLKELSKQADQRMYVDKALYYESKGVDRRGQQAAFDVLCKSYERILKVNLTKDTYSVIHMDATEKARIMHIDRISQLLKDSAVIGQINPDDVENYLKTINLENIRRHFKEGNTNFIFNYKRKIGRYYRKILLEIIPSNDYTDSNQTVFMYEKRIVR